MGGYLTLGVLVTMWLAWRRHRRSVASYRANRAHLRPMTWDTARYPRRPRAFGRFRTMGKR